jgi:hypothetical protein
VGDRRREVEDDQDHRWEAEGARDRRRGVEGGQGREVEEGLRSQQFGLMLKPIKQQQWKRLSLGPLSTRANRHSHGAGELFMCRFIQRYRAVHPAI